MTIAVDLGRKAIKQTNKSHDQNVFHAMLGKKYSKFFVFETNGPIAFGLGWLAGCLVLLLYVPSQQLWSLRDGQFT